MAGLRRLMWPLMTALLVVAVAACGGGDDDDGGSAPVGPGGAGAGKDAATKSSGSSPGNDSGSCEVKLSGDETASWKGKGGMSAVGSDYWYSDDEMKKILAALGGSVDEAMKQDPRFFLLILNCGTPGGANSNSVSIFPSSATKYKDVPFKAGEYPIPVQGALGGAQKPGEFSVMLSVGEASYKVVEAGKLKLTKFDRTGIAGSFSYKAEEVFPQGAAKKVNVEGTFDFACSTGDNCKK